MKQNDFLRARRELQKADAQQRRVRESTDRPIEVPMKQEVIKTTKLGAAVQKKRGDRALRDLARELNEPHTNIQHIERGRMPGPALFVKLVQWLGVIDDDVAKKLLKYAE